MTDAAIAGGAAAGAPILDIPNVPNELGQQAPDAPPQPEVKDKPVPSIRDALKNASKQAEARQNEAKKPPEVKDAKPVEGKEGEQPKPDAKDAKPESVKAERDRAPDGKFAAKEQRQESEPNQPAKASYTDDDPPARFSPDAKAKWFEADPAIRGETHRAIKELTEGYEKHRADAEAYREVKEYADLAKQYGTTIKQALDNYTGLEKLLHKNPIAGLEQVVANLNLKTNDGRALTLHDVAAHVLGQKPDELASKQNSTIQELRSQIAALQQQIGGVTQTVQQQRVSTLESQIAAFKESHPRFDDLATDIHFFLQSGRTKDLAEAYELAERLNPAPSKATPAKAAEADTDQPKPLNPAGQKSISGAPASGSSPATRTGPAPSTREALRRALARAGA